MASIVDYISWRGDLTFDQDPFNEVDGMILSELSYIDFRILGARMPKSLREAGQLWTQGQGRDQIRDHEIIRQPAFDLLVQAGQSDRFGPLEIRDFVYEVSQEDDSQFGAISYFYGDHLLFVAFQGTDLHVIGWKEDFALTYLPAIPSQEKAKAYLRAHLDQVDYPIYLGGHSKGGNLAVYSLAFQDRENQDKVAQVFNYDGPGFMEDILLEPSYQRIVDKISTIIPQDSLVGLLLHRLEDPIVIRSDCKNIKQHLGYYWDLEGKAFIRAKLSKEAKALSLVLGKTLSQLNEDQRRDLTDAVFSLFGENLEDNLIIGTRAYNIKKFQQAILQLGRLPNEAKKLLVDVVVLFIRNGLDKKGEDDEDR